MTDISSKQEQDWNLTLFMAQQRLYSRAKIILALQAFLAIVSPISAVVYVLATGVEIKDWVSLGYLILVYIDQLLLSPWRRKICEHGARIHELFDHNVLGICWNRMLAKEKPAMEEAKRVVPKAQAMISDANNKKVDGLKQWYLSIVDKLQQDKAAIVCQRGNCSFNEQLHSRYADCIRIISIVISVTFLGWGIYTKSNMHTFFFSVFVPLSPTILWAVHTVMQHKEAGRNWKRIHQVAVDVFEKKKPHETESRTLQDWIFVYRGIYPPIFAWFYRLHKKRIEGVVNDTTETIVGSELSKKWKNSSN